MISRQQMIGVLTALLVAGTGIAISMTIPGHRTIEYTARKQSVYEIHDAGSFAARSKVFNMMPFGNIDLQFEFHLPDDWTAQDLAGASADALKERITGPVAKFASPMIGTRTAYAQVDVLHLDYEISARNWLKNYITSSGAILQGEVIEMTNKSAAGYYTYAPVDSSEARYVYFLARIAGKNVETARLDVPIQLKSYLAFLQKKSVDSFRLLNPKDDVVEDVRSFMMVDALKFNYPASWDVVTTDFHDTNRLVVTLQCLNGSTRPVVQGYINVLAVRRSVGDSLQMEIEKMRSYFNEVMNLGFRKMVATGASEANERFLFNRYEVYDVVPRLANKETAPAEINLVVLGDKEWYIFMFLFTPKESTDLAVWARNVQSFREVIKSIR